MHQTHIPHYHNPQSSFVAHRPTGLVVSQVMGRCLGQQLPATAQHAEKSLDLPGYHRNQRQLLLNVCPSHHKKVEKSLNWSLLVRTSVFDCLTLSFHCFPVSHRVITVFYMQTHKHQEMCVTTDWRHKSSHNNMFFIICLFHNNLSNRWEMVSLGSDWCRSLFSFLNVFGFWDYNYISPFSPLNPLCISSILFKFMTPFL